MSAVAKRLIPFASVCDALSLALQTGYNQVSAGRFPLPVVRIGRRLFCRPGDVDEFVETGVPLPPLPGATRAPLPPQPSAKRRGPGRPSKSEQIRARGAA